MILDERGLKDFWQAWVMGVEEAIGGEVVVFVVAGHFDRLSDRYFDRVNDRYNLKGRLGEG